MAGISSKALSFGDPENNQKYNGIEYDNSFDVDEYEAFYRNLDPQIGRWWQIDPEIEIGMEGVSSYASMYDNPIHYSDFKGNTPEPSDPPDNGSGAKKILKKTAKIAGTIILVGGGPEDVPADAVAGVTLVAGAATAGIVWIYHQFAHAQKRQSTGSKKKNQDNHMRQYKNNKKGNSKNKNQKKGAEERRTKYKPID